MTRLHSPRFGLVLALAGAAAVAALAGCKKDSSSSSSSSSNPADQQQSPRDYFISSVYPRVGAPGACADCHSGLPNSPCGDPSCVFLGADGPSSYDLLSKQVGLIAAPANSPLLTYQHKDKTIQLTPDQANVLGIWLGMEATARHLPGAVLKASNVADAYKQFGACMNFDVWTQTGMDNLAQTETDFDGPCLGCHNKGQGSIFLAADSYATFQNFQKFPFIQKLVVGTVDSNGNFDQLVPSLRILEKADEGCPVGVDPTQCHPRFGLSDDMKASLEYFVNLTLQNLAANSCQNGIVSGDAGTPSGDGGPEGGQ